mmetsp:Transcript_43776/g.108919  ORF Transcript_43776/g.108919 Transcript_43776/m.108919 type:complete len:94 (+) Transcript_43776:82-363(+)
MLIYCKAELERSGANKERLGTVVVASRIVPHLDMGPWATESELHATKVEAGHAPALPPSCTLYGGLPRYTGLYSPRRPPPMLPVMGGDAALEL